MGLRFRKSVKIAPGVHVNFGRRSVGISAGVNGARVSVNSSGRRTTSVGVPGTGISYVSTSSGGGRSRSGSAYSSGGSDYDDGLYDSSVSALFNPAEYRKNARNTKINSITFRIFLAILAVMFLMIGVVYPVCFALCALCVFGFVKVQKSWRGVYDEFQTMAELSEILAEDLTALETEQAAANNANSLVELILIYDRMKPVVESIKNKASRIDKQFLFDPDSMLKETFDGRFSELIDKEFRQELASINKLKTRRTAQAHVQNFRHIMDSAKDKFTSEQNERASRYISELERAVEIIAPEET